jgi:glycosyltransferase involved in cell wall biosynthesis
MLRNQIYYRVKPFFPKSVRFAVRRWFALRKLHKVRDVWPIMPGSERTPLGWPGWPDGRKFALVLTHDVEGDEGLQKCRDLMRVEMEMGFRSSFNFIPEGSYRVPPDLREELVRNGFEVGIHDLKHDGLLFDNRKEFDRRAARINSYLHEWDAVGFRSGFMLNKLEWFHKLNLEYDASTFDTDPFEPQPHGRNTIFPFFVPNASPPRSLGSSGGNGDCPTATNRKRGFVELPYTLPQDHTLFLILREQSIDTWKRKIDWIAENGGLALLDTHPDYMAMNGHSRNRLEYPVSHYREFLQYIRQRFGDSYWHVTAKQVARWYIGTLQSEESQIAGMPAEKRPLAGKKGVVVLYSYFPADPRPCREAEALLAAGMQVDIICLRQGSDEPTQEIFNGINVRRVPMRHKREGKLSYFVQYGYFILWSTVALGFRSLRKRYDLVHVHNMPDILVFSGVVPKCLGAKLILDLHDPMPELLITIFGIPESHFAVRLVKLLERWSIRFADKVVTVNLRCREIFSKRSCDVAKISVIMNAPDEKIFRFREYEVLEHRTPVRPFILMFHGSIVERHGLDLAVQAVRLAMKTVRKLELRIYGSATPFLRTVMESCGRDGLDNVVRYLGEKSLEEIVKAIEECDLGVIPNRRSVFTQLNTPTRIFEYLACGKPVIAPRVPGICDYFGEQDLIFFEIGDVNDLARKIEYAFNHPDKVRETVSRGQKIYGDHTWHREEKAFVNLVEEQFAN